MLLWVLLLGGLALIFGTVGVMLSMGRAERRARRKLYRSLGLTETTVEFLMERNRDVLTELSYVRREGESAIGETARAAPERDRNVVFLRPGPRAVQPLRGAPFEREGRSPATDPDPSSPDGHTRH
jgi:hypothetical protein